MQRRQLLQTAGAAAAGLGLDWAHAALQKGRHVPHVVVVGGGYGGATAAKYLRLWSVRRVAVTLVEPNPVYVSCPLSNLVLGGSKTMADISLSYQTLSRRHGVRLRHESALAIDPLRRQVRLSGGDTLAYDRLVLSPGVDFIPGSLPGLDPIHANDRANTDATPPVLHAWKAGPQTQALRQQLQAMPDGGVFAITVPLLPYRCPPGPYERACQVAWYFSRFKPRSKVLILDENPDVSSKAALFKSVWSEHYKDRIEYRPQHKLLDVDRAARSLKFEFQDEVQADVLNVLPPMQAGRIAVDTGLANINRRWCEVDFLSFESRVAAHIHVLGDAIQPSPLMPKSGHMANQHGKTCAAAVLALLAGQAPNPMPLYNNACYSFINDREAMHISSVHRYDRSQNTMLAVPDSGGLSAAPSLLEGQHALAWARNIWADTWS